MEKVMRKDYSGKKFPIYYLRKRKEPEQTHEEGTRRSNLKKKCDSYKVKKTLFWTEDPLRNILEWSKE